VSEEFAGRGTQVGVAGVRGGAGIRGMRQMAVTQWRLKTTTKLMVGEMLEKCWPQQNCGATKPSNGCRNGKRCFYQFRKGRSQSEIK